MFRVVTDLFKRKEPSPLYEFETGSVNVRVFEKTCGHPGHMCELFVRVGSDFSVMIGVIDQVDLQHAIMVLQEAMAAINDREQCARMLQTTWLCGAVYFVDERLGELRKKDDPSDRIRIGD